MVYFRPLYLHLYEHQPYGIIHEWIRLDLRNNPIALIYFITATIIRIEVKSVKYHR